MSTDSAKRVNSVDVVHPFHEYEESILQVLDAQGRVALDLGRSDWADWSRSGELLFASEGRLYRIVVDGKSELGTPEELIDLRGLKFDPIVAPPQATVWNGRSPRGRALAK